MLPRPPLGRRKMHRCEYPPVAKVQRGKRSTVEFSWNAARQSSGGSTYVSAWLGGYARLSHPSSSMEGVTPPSDDASEALGGAAPQDERTSLLFTGDGARSGRATARLSSAAASFGAARAGRLSVRIPRGTLSGAAQAVPARLAWSPDPAWSTPSQAAPSRQEPRKRARQGHVVAARQTPAESDGGFGSSDAAAGGGWWQPSGEDQYFFSDNSDADLETDSDSVSVRASTGSVPAAGPAVAPN